MRGIASDVSPATGSHIVCYCDDCQAYARFLGRDDTVDERGGTEIFQTTPSRVTITEKASELRCVRLSDKGMLRFYTGCCRTPIGNLLPSPRVPFVGIVASFIGESVGGEPRDALLGPVTSRVQGRFAVGGLPPGAHPSAPVSVIARAITRLFRGFVAGAHRPSPFFDARTGRPVAEPEVLSVEQRRSLRPVTAAG